MAARRELQTKVDWAPVEEVISSFKLPRWDVEDLQQMIAAASLKWLDEDVAYGVYSVERTFKLDTWEPSFIGTTDLQLGSLGKRIADWKTTSKADQEWLGRMQQSWQWRLYLYATGADEFVYRGVQRDGYVREFKVHRYAGMNEAVENYLKASYHVLEGLYPFSIYPMKRPFACRAYGRPCPYVRDCFEKDGADPGSVDFSQVGIHYSTLDLLYLCPERFRRDNRIGADSESSDESDFGTVFHKAIAKLYEQFVISHGNIA